MQTFPRVARYSSSSCCSWLACPQRMDALSEAETLHSLTSRCSNDRCANTYFLTPTQTLEAASWQTWKFFLARPRELSAAADLALFGALVLGVVAAKIDLQSIALNSSVTMPVALRRALPSVQFSACLSRPRPRQHGIRTSLLQPGESRISPQHLRHLGSGCSSGKAPRCWHSCGFPDLPVVGLQVREH